MVTLKHEIPSGMEYEYADHTISNRPGPLLEAGIAPNLSQNEPPLPPLGRDDGQSQKPKSQFEEFMDSMSPAGRREYIGQLDISMQQILDQSREPGRAVGHDYELQLKLLELQNKKRILRQKIKQDGRERVIASASVSHLRTLEYQEQLYLLEAQSAKLEQAWMKSASLDRQNQRLAGPPNGMHLPPLNSLPVAYPCDARLSTGLDKRNVYSEPTLSWSLNDVLRHQSLMDPNATGVGNPSSVEQTHAMHHPFQNFSTCGANYHDLPPTKYYDTNTGETSYKTPGPRLLQPNADGNLVDTDGSVVYHANNINEVSGPGCSAFASRQQGECQSHSVSAYPTYQPNFPPSYQPRQHPFVSGPSRCLPDYQMQLMLLEQQNKKILMMARQEQDAMLNPPTTIQESCQIGSSILEQQNKEQLMRQRQQQDSMMGMFRVNPQEVQQDYQLQLMQLEQQSKERLMHARPEQDSMTGTFRANPQDRRQQDYQMQLMLLEQQNKKRLIRARTTGQDLMAPIFKAEPCPSPEPRSYLPGSPGMSCSPAPSSIIFTPESSVAPSLPSTPQNVLNFDRPLEIRGPAPENSSTTKS